SLLWQLRRFPSLLAPGSPSNPEENHALRRPDRRALDRDRPRGLCFDEQHDFDHHELDDVGLREHRNSRARGLHVGSRPRRDHHADRSPVRGSPRRRRRARGAGHGGAGQLRRHLHRRPEVRQLVRPAEGLPVPSRQPRGDSRLGRRHQGHARGRQAATDRAAAPRLWSGGLRQRPDSAQHHAGVRDRAARRALMIRRAALLLVLAALAASPVAAQKATPARRTPLAPDTRMLKDLPLRSIGPANMGGRVSDLAVVEKTPTTFYVALGTGGVMKTVNLGTTWSAVFEKQAVASVGAVAVWQKNPQIVWVGTGEANSRNSSSWGNGVYVSKDGGGEWKHLGLEATHNIARVVTDPGDSNIVYVAALGRLWGENAERGVYKTVDGGKSWQQVLKVDARTGACDLVMDPAHPQVLYAAMYARKRTPWSYSGVGVTGGIFRTRDGGRTWKKLAGGLPARTGRIGLDLCRSKPNVVVAVVESDEGGQLDDTEDLSRAGGVFRSDDGGDNWKRTSPWSPRPFYFSQIRVQPNDDQRVYLLGYEMWISDDGGRSFRREGAKNLHPDLHAMWIHPENGDHVVLGTDGGVYLSHDRTRNWRFLDNLAAGEFYTVTVDDRDPYRVYGGLQDNQSWGGPSSTRFEVQQWI